MNIESWCQVEGRSNAEWTRATRRHYDHALESTVFAQERPGPEGRVDWSMAKRPAQQKLAKKKHFLQKCKWQCAFVQIHSNMLPFSVQMRQR